MTMRLTLGAALLVLSLSVAKLLFAQGAAPSGWQVKTAITGEDRDRLLAAGKTLFVERCASQRELSAKELARIVSGRLKDSPDEDKRAVTLYISTLLTKK